MEALKPNPNESYQEYIIRILNIRQNIKSTTFYMEHHHILPKCMGGEDIEDNMIWLLPEEHYYCHELLALENPDNESLSHAWWMMSGRFNEYVSAEIYANLKQIFHDMMVINNTGEENPFYGKQHTEEHKQYMKEKMKGRIITQETRQKISESRKGKYTGPDNPFYGKHYTEKEKEAAMLRKKNRTSVQCVETGEKYRSAREAGRKTGISQGSISRCIKDERSTAGGYHWVRIENFE